MQTTRRLGLLIAIALPVIVAGCENEDDCSSCASQASGTSSESGVDENVSISTSESSVDVDFHAINDTSADAIVRVRDADGGYHSQVLEAHSSARFWIHNASRGSDVYLEAWAPRVQTWITESYVEVENHDLSETVYITSHWYGGLGIDDLTID